MKGTDCALVFCRPFRLLFLLAILIFLFFVVRYYFTKPSLNKLHAVAGVKSGGELILDNGAVVEISGITIFNQHLKEATVRINQLVENRKVIIFPTSRPNTYDVLIWGSPVEILSRDAKPFEVVGAKDVDVGFLNIQRGTCINLREVLVNEGLAEKRSGEKGKIKGSGRLIRH